MNLDLETVWRWARRRDITCESVAGASVLLLKHLFNGDLPVRVIDHGERQMMTFAVLLPAAVPAERTDATAMAVNLCNSSTYMGAWVFNTETREVYLKVTVPAAGLTWSDEALAFLLGVVVSTFSTLGPRLLAVISEGGAPESVIQAEDAAQE